MSQTVKTAISGTQKSFKNSLFFDFSPLFSPVFFRESRHFGGTFSQAF
jgi:hypothetical protein